MSDKTRVAGTDQWSKYGSGFVGGLSEEQQELVDKFLAVVPRDKADVVRFPDEPWQYFACRLLRARKFVVEDALVIVENSSKWRTEAKVAELGAMEPSDILGVEEDELLFFYPKAYFPTTDREGRPVYVERGGAVDFEPLFALLNGDLERMAKYHTHGNERMIRHFSKCSAMAGRPITTITTVMDFTGMGMGLLNPVARDYVTQAAAQDKEHYPEVLAKMFIINVPSFFSLAFNMIKPFLDERTVKKIEIISAQSDWLPKLAAHMGGLDRVPVEYGGTLVIEGGLYHTSRTRLESINAGKTFTRTVPVKAGQTIRFKWLCRPGDMKMGVTFHPGAVAATALPDGVAALNPLTSSSFVVYKLQDHPGSEKAFVTVPSYTAPEDGVLVAVWSNAAGWRKRDLFHRFDELDAAGRAILPPRPLENLRTYVAAAGASEPS